MDNKIALRDKVKGQVLIMILYIFSEIAVYFFLLDKSTLGDWKTEGKKLIAITGFICFILVLSVVIKAFKRRKYFCYLGGTECVMLSLALLYTILEGYYNLYEKIGFEIIYIYMAAVLILFLGCRKFYKKLPSEEELNKKKKIEPQTGLSYVVAASTLGVLRHLTKNQEQVVGVICSLVIVCGWVALGWFMFQGTKVYINDTEEETVNEE